MKESEVRRLIEIIGEISALEAPAQLEPESSSCLSMTRLYSIAEYADATPKEQGHIGACTRCSKRSLAFDAVMGRTTPPPPAVTFGRRTLLSLTWKLLAATTIVTVGWFWWQGSGGMSSITPMTPSCLLIADTAMQPVPADEATRSASSEGSTHFVAKIELLRSAYVRLVAVDQAGDFSSFYLYQESNQTQHYPAGLSTLSDFSIRHDPPFVLILFIASEKAIDDIAMSAAFPEADPGNLSAPALERLQKHWQSELKCDVQSRSAIQHSDE